MLTGCWRLLGGHSIATGQQWYFNRIHYSNHRLSLSYFGCLAACLSKYATPVHDNQVDTWYSSFSSHVVDISHTERRAEQRNCLPSSLQIYVKKLPTSKGCAYHPLTITNVTSAMLEPGPTPATLVINTLKS